MPLCMLSMFFSYLSYVFLCLFLFFLFFLFFFFNDTATTEIYTLSLHDALPIFADVQRLGLGDDGFLLFQVLQLFGVPLDRKSTRLNSSHPSISYAVFCLKKKKKKKKKKYMFK